MVMWSHPPRLRGLTVAGAGVFLLVIFCSRGGPGWPRLQGGAPSQMHLSGPQLVPAGNLRGVLKTALPLILWGERGPLGQSPEACRLPTLSELS